MRGSAVKAASECLPKRGDGETSEMSKADEMIERAKNTQMKPEEAEVQRRSFAYGNAKAENDRVTREMVDRAAAKHPKG